MAKFDWYEATFFEINPLDLVREIERAHPFALIEPDRPQHGYRVGQVFKHGGDAMARVWWEGNEGVHVSTTSSHAHQLAPLLRGHGVHFPTRVDACEDWIEHGLFDRMADHLTAYAVAHRITITQLGDWVRGQARTLYLGSKHSAVRLVLYEKGYEQGANPDWVRLEIRCRPKGRTNRLLFSQLTPGQVFGAARWVVAALEGLGWDHLQAMSIGTVYRPSDDERARRVFLKQYGGILARWIDEFETPADFAAELVSLLNNKEVAPS